MDSRTVIGRSLGRFGVALLVALVCAFALLAAALIGAGGAQAQTSGAAGLPTQQMPLASGGSLAAVEECVTVGAQAERAATFSGEMSAVAGTARMAIRIDVEERAQGEAEFHMVSAPGLGVWRPSDPKVKVYKYLKQVTNLSAPAAYRGLVRFRWIGAKGHAIKRAERLTSKCVQPAESEPVEPTPTTPTGTTTDGSSPKS
ncbi:MAG TPA: hypothetical protein VMB05_13235 [Solirubrobacteraceae bacterium]|nr:hypothetical protein [Solirubrobacteraceae bacterium]